VSNETGSYSETDINTDDVEQLVESLSLEVEEVAQSEGAEQVDAEPIAVSKLPKMIAALPKPARVLSPVMQRTFSPPRADPLDDLHPVEVFSTPLVRKESKKRAKRALPRSEVSQPSPLQSSEVISSISAVLNEPTQEGERIAAMYFLCNICLEKHNTSDMRSIEGCGHQYSEHCVAYALRTSGQRRYNCSSCQDWLAKMYLKSCQKWLEEDLQGTMP
jgi:hypothetical protein